MPVPPSTYLTETPVVPFQLNTDLYTYIPGNAHAPTGILFHSSPPILYEVLRASPGFGQASSAGGSNTSYQQPSGVAWQNMYDTSCLFGPGQDAVGSTAGGNLNPQVAGSSGAAGVVGGWYLMFGLATWAATTNAGMSGALLNHSSGSLLTAGGMQGSNVGFVNSSYVLDLVSVSSTDNYETGGRCADASANTFALSSNATYNGTCCRFTSMWAGVSTGGTTVSPLPNPNVAWLPTSSVTTSYLNGANGIGGVLSFLNNKPMLRAHGNPTTALAANTGTLIPGIGTADVDTYGGFNTGTGIYTVQVSGVYLLHVCASVTSFSGRVMTGIKLNGTTDFWGVTCESTNVDHTRPQFTRLVDLNAGDTLEIQVWPTAATSMSSANPTRIILLWVSTLAPSNSAWNWTAPDTGFRWQAGTPGGTGPLYTQFNQHLTNDLSFLLQRPYLLSYQTVAQTGFTVNTDQVITMDTVAGAFHGSPGQSYGGWTSGAANKFSAIVPGFYLVVAGYYQTVISTTPGNCQAKVGYYISNGTAQGNVATDLYQSQLSNSNSTTTPPGAEAVGIYYLDVGDYVQPVYRCGAGSATWGTTTSPTRTSHFGAVWVSE